MWGKSLMLACAITVLVSPLGRLDAQGKAPTIIVALPSGETVEIVTDSLRLPPLQMTVTLELPAGTTAMRTDGGDIFRRGQPSPFPRWRSGHWCNRLHHHYPPVQRSSRTSTGWSSLLKCTSSRVDP